MTNRETIKFRVWDYNGFLNSDAYCLFPRDGYGDLLEVRKIIDYGQMKVLPDAIIQQYTGLTDKNGVEIYEGDILKCKGFDGWFDQVGFYYNVVVKHTIIESGESQIAGFAYIPIDREVIGNIFETPELSEA